MKKKGVHMFTRPKVKTIWMPIKSTMNEEVVTYLYDGITQHWEWTIIYIYMENINESHECSIDHHQQKAKHKRTHTIILYTSIYLKRIKQQR